jgi:7-cyano-7-deazaguanine synthase
MALKKAAIICHSGGMDSSICLAMAIREWGVERVLSMGFSYGQRHSDEHERAQRICEKWGVDRVVVPIGALAKITEDALTNHALDIEHVEGEAPTTLVMGRNGLMARLAAIHAAHLGANCIYMGVIQVESDNSGYRDCSRDYMDLMQQILRIDLDNPGFEIRTPVVAMTKRETMHAAHEFGELEFLLDTTITCYRGLPHAGCQKCPACDLRNEGIRQFLSDIPDFKMPFIF